MREALTYMFKDNCFYKKAVMYCILIFFASTFSALADMSSCTGSCQLITTPIPLTQLKFNVLLYRIASLFLYILSLGYFISSLEAVNKQENNIIFPFFNFKLNLIKGIKFALALFTTVILYYVLTLLFVIVGSKFIPVITEVTTSLIALFTLLYIICYNSFLYSYASENKLLNFFNFKKAFLPIKKAPKTYFKFWSLLILVSLASTVITYLFEILFGLFNNAYLVMLLTNIIAAIVGTYTTYVSFLLIRKSSETDSVV